MALSVAKPTAQPKITVGVPFTMTGPLQGSSYNPQQTAPSTVLQNPAPVSYYQPTYNPQPATYNPQPAARVMPAAPTAAQVAAAAEQVRVAAAVEAARQEAIRKEALRVKVQGEVDTKVATNKQAFTLQVQNPTWRGKIALGKKMVLPKISLPQQSEYDKAYADAYRKAMNDVNGKTKIGKQNIAQKVWDKATFGSDRRASEARKYAEKQATDAVDKSTATYKKNLDNFLKTQAQKKAAVEGTKFLTQSQFDKAVADYTAWESGQISQLENQRAATNAQIDAYGKASSAPLTSAAAKGASMFNRNVIHGVPGNILGNVWQYTLGSGSEHIPSLVTAPGRLVNTLGNLNTKDRTIYQEGGTQTNRAGSAKDAWESSFNQRSFNLKPVTDRPYNKKEAEKKFGEQAKREALSWSKAGVKDPALSTYDGELQRYWRGMNADARNKNTAIDLAADPINLLGGVGKIGKATKLGDKILAPVKASKFGSFLGKTAGKVSSNKAIQWLGAEHKTPEQHLADAIDEAKGAQKKAQGILPRVNRINQELAASGGRPLDVTGLTGLKQLTDSEVPILKRMVDGKLSRRDRLWLAGPGNAEARAKLEGIATKWQDFAEQMRLPDKVYNTRFGKGKLTYAPDTTFLERKGESLSKYNFRALKRGKGPRTADDFYQSAVDRYFKSNLDEAHQAGESTRVARLHNERDRLIQRYDQQLNPAREKVLAADAKTKTPFNRARRAVRNVTPMALWKKSVLKYRPAWYVNNEFYNTQAAMLAGGPGALAEKARLLRPKNWRKALDEIPGEVKSNLSREIGNDRVARFASRQENWSRIAAFRAAKKKGLSDEEALKRVNRYLFDYKTRNWERPIKAVVPFWQFQKNVAKAAAVMPFDRPLAAKGYNEIDRYQQQQYDKDFNTVIPKLKSLGYSDSEIEKIRKDNAKYFQGKLKIGGKYWNTPFNAFSEKQMSQLGFNPFLAAAGETADSVDSFGSPIKGQDASWQHRLITKSPQADLAVQAKRAFDVQAGKSKPHSSWIGAAGHEGYGLTKEKQGYDKSKSNYVRSMDPRAKLGQNALAFAGVPRSMEFDKKKLIQAKTVQQASKAYFADKWKVSEKDEPNSTVRYQKEQANLKKMFAQYGMKPDDFYKGILAKYDSEQTKNIKQMKEDAAKSTSSLFAEYGRQPKGTRNIWATNKLRELVAQGYFDKNPFLKSFDWVNPSTVAKADKQSLVLEALKTGDWSKYQAKFGLTEKQKDYKNAVSSGDWSAWRSKYGVKSQKAKDYILASSTGNWDPYTAKYGKTEKALARDKAVASHNWTDYTAKYATTTKQTPFQFAGKYFKTADSMAKYKEGEFWRSYALATPAERKKLLAENPQYNTRANWTAAMWMDQKKKDKAELKAKLNTVSGFSSRITDNKTKASQMATRFLTTKGTARGKKVKWA